MTTENNKLVIDRVGDFFEVFDTQKQETVFTSEFFGEALDFVFGKWEGNNDDDS